jgi:crotonobetainyl-CoA:carnitine CoA-transferase CaiB-like acyl-CoA transferase
MNPLRDIRVLDFTRILAGPFCTMLLSDMGAEVIKIEEPQKGDETRSYGPPFVEGWSTYFLSVNRGKKSLTLNLKHPKTKGIVLNLVQKADVLVENFRPGTMAELGLDYPTLSRINSRLIYCSISGFGQTGPESKRPGYDLIIQGISGLMDLTGEPGGKPLKVGTSIADLVTGLYAVQAILLAILNRERTGKGEYLDISLFESLVSMLTYQASLYFGSGEPKRMGNQHPSICPYETFQAKDGSFNIAVANDRLWEKFCKAIGREDLIFDPRFHTNPDRVKNRPQLVQILNDIFQTNTVSHWVKLLDEHGIPAGPILSVSEVLSHPHLKERGMFMEFFLGEKPFRFLANAIPVLRQVDGKKPPPALGADTETLLRDWLGLLPAEIEALRKEGAV